MDKETREFLESMMQNINNRFNESENRFDGLENRFDGLESRFDVLESRFDGLENRFDGLESRFDGLEVKVAGIEVKVDDLDKGQKEIKNLIQKLEPKNANRYLELKESINELRKNMSTVEEVTAKNWTDIIELKKAK